MRHWLLQYGLQKGTNTLKYSPFCRSILVFCIKVVFGIVFSSIIGKYNNMNQLNDLITKAQNLRVLCQGIDPLALGLKPTTIENIAPGGKDTSQRILVITNKSLQLPLRGPIWGYASKKRNMAVVSPEPWSRRHKAPPRQCHRTRIRSS